MSGRKPSWRITALIETHNLSSPYSTCSGCSICSMIEKISKEAGLWIKTQPNEHYYHGNQKITYEELEKYLDEGYLKKEICKMTGIAPSTLTKRMIKWFPERHERRENRKLSIDLKDYKRLLAEGMKREDIAKQQGITLRMLDYNVGKWYREDKRHESSKTQQRSS